MTLNFNLNQEQLVYHVISSECSGWKVFYYKEFENVIGELGKINSDVEQKLLPYLAINSPSHFRIQLHFRSVSFLVAFFFDSKEIRIATPKLSNELFILQHPDILSLEIEAVKQMRKHAEKIASLSFKEFPSVIEVLTATKNLPNFLTVVSITDFTCSSFVTSKGRNVMSAPFCLKSAITDASLSAFLLVITTL